MPPSLIPTTPSNPIEGVETKRVASSNGGPCAWFGQVDGGGDGEHGQVRDREGQEAEEEREA